jgi:hypothetical protein
MRDLPLAAAVPLLPILLVACTPQIETSGGGEHVSSTDDSLRGCHGQASTTIPDDGIFVVTTFGGAGDQDSGPMSCGQSTQNGSWYYAASRQRFGCSAHVRLTTADKCVVVETDDYGPDACVENAAGRPIMDVSPKAARALFGVSAAGWSERRTVQVEQVDDGTPLGPCDPTASAPSPPAPLTQCSSATLGCDLPLSTCVQSNTDDLFYQCTSLGWVKLYADGTGLLGPCTDIYPLGSSCPAP